MSGVALLLLGAVLGAIIVAGACLLLGISRIADLQAEAMSARREVYVAHIERDFYQQQERRAVLDALPLVAELDHFTGRSDVAAERRARIARVLDAFGMLHPSTQTASAVVSLNQMVANGVADSSPPFPPENPSP